ncbi:putative SET (Su(var)3-9, Enhancer-of-zeste, Trithorax) domain protein, partial [Trypoxylus dichotomus]
CYHNLEEGVFWLLSNLGAKANNDLPKTVPKNFLKIDQNVSVLRCIPQDIIFGPYADFESLQNVTSLIWILNGGRQTEIDNKFLDNWMRFISFSTDKDRCNLSVFQCNRFLYFRTIRNIACEEELLAYLDERLVKPSSEKCYYPIEEDIPQAYACMPCCLGFKTEGYLRKHLEICFNNKESNRSLADIVQCPHCKMVSFDRKHLKHHISRNCVGDKR